MRNSLPEKREWPEREYLGWVARMGVHFLRNPSLKVRCVLLKNVCHGKKTDVIF